MRIARNSRDFFFILLFVNLATSFTRPFSFRNNLFSKFANDAYLNEQEPRKKPNRRERRRLLKRKEYERRRQIWEERYGSFEALQNTFQAGPRNLSPEETRHLYHSLLPRSLLGLYEMGLMNPEELAPLAYKARKASKDYARSRCVWTARFATTVFDQYRNIRDKKRFGPSSMTWEEIYQKYEAQIVREERAKDFQDGEERKITRDEDFTMRVYVRILERSCETNQAFDSLFLRNGEGTSDYLAQISSQLENDVRSILLCPKENAKALRKQRRVKRRQQRIMRKAEKKRIKGEKREERARKEKPTTKIRQEREQEGPVIVDTPSVKRWKVIKLLASARREFRLKKRIR